MPGGPTDLLCPKNSEKMPHVEGILPLPRERETSFITRDGEFRIEKAVKTHLVTSLIYYRKPKTVCFDLFSESHISMSSCLHEITFSINLLYVN